MEEDIVADLPCPDDCAPSADFRGDAVYHSPAGNPKDDQVFPLHLFFPDQLHDGPGIAALGDNARPAGHSWKVHRQVAEQYGFHTRRSGLRGDVRSTARRLTGTDPSSKRQPRPRGPGRSLRGLVLLARSSRFRMIPESSLHLLCRIQGPHRFRHGSHHVGEFRPRCGPPGEMLPNLSKPAYYRRRFIRANFLLALRLPEM